MEFVIRSASYNDAEGISRVIIAALRETNARDYPEAVIARVEQNFSPVSVSELITQRLVFVATSNDVIVGIASLDDGVVRTVFVDPKHHGRGIGKALMTVIEEITAERGVKKLTVPSGRRLLHKTGFHARAGQLSRRRSGRL